MFQQHYFAKIIILNIIFDVLYCPLLWNNDLFGWLGDYEMDYVKHFPLGNKDQNVLMVKSYWSFTKMDFCWLFHFFKNILLSIYKIVLWERYVNDYSSCSRAMRFRSELIIMAHSVWGIFLGSLRYTSYKSVVTCLYKFIRLYGTGQAFFSWFSRKLP